ncbi:hypothetical protein Terro_2722 [Terriglobus roseus DSM 18391]|uniref:Uncharacterized protein n=1 Tax=Terriglobus roseus (strain DSM 18391 / NRRL B-41598 / KBS 63) TaxID=926566 RepID=I3ZI90_TERRK|nr:hypothetical protein [Terriglobus roseus]AFL88958.1 hypothetical protein Terro_2722 [Terriglobus roseus DSM 18391]
MVTREKGVWIAVGTAAALLLAFALWWKFSPQPLPDPVTSNTFSGFDDLQSQLATRVHQYLDPKNSAPDFDVVVSGASMDEGTILRPSTTLAVSYDDCLPTSGKVREFSAPNLFPVYHLTRDVAVKAGFDDSRLAKLNLNVGRSTDVLFSIADVKLRMLDDNAIDTVTGTGACLQDITKSGLVWYVKGYISGKRTFRTAVQNAGSLSEQGGPYKIQVDGSPQNQSLSITDSEGQPFLALISVVPRNRDGKLKTVSSAPAVAADSPKKVEVGITHVLPHSPVSAAPPPVAAPPPLAPTGAAKGRIFVQQDQADAAGAGAVIVEALRRGGYDPISQVEKVPSRKMPSVAQIRYFNDGPDEATARSLQRILVATYPSARIVRVGVPSPQGQFEVWLPRAANH